MFRCCCLSFGLALVLGTLVSAFGERLDLPETQLPDAKSPPPATRRNAGGSPDGSPTFVNWESPHVHPLDLTPDGTKLLAVNTPDNRLQVFDVTGPTLTPIAAVPVGLDPVSVRARTNNEAWVVNHISDSVSIVDLTTMNVTATLRTGDEPADVVFAGNPERAFVSCSGTDQILVFNPSNLAAAPSVIPIDADRPRALAVNPSRTRVYAAIFESGNASTVLGGGIALTGDVTFPPNVVNDPTGPYGGVNPPPNRGTSFVPPINPLNPPAPRVSLIVKRNGAGRWMDDNNRDWTGLVSGPNAARSGRRVGWTLPDRDVAVILMSPTPSSTTYRVRYAHGLMNINMGIAVNPMNGRVTVVGTDATNEVRFEPNLKGRFLRVEMGIVDPSNLSRLGVVDLNAHLNYQVPTIPPAERVKALGDPRALVWNSTGTRGYVSGMGSNNLIVIDQNGNRIGINPTIPVGEGPTGLALDEANGRLFVLNKFASTISIVDTALELEVARTPFYDPSPATIKRGRRHLYATHTNSGLGHIGCASCHVDARNDRLAWDLGDPAGAMKPLGSGNRGMNIPGLNTPGDFAPFHPMKGPMTTQTLLDIIGKEPHHWRGDRDGLEEFNGAFVGLQGNDRSLTSQEMQDFENFLATLYFPPNPYRNFDNTLPTNVPLPGHYTPGRFGPAGQPLPNGNAAQGRDLYRSVARRLDRNAFPCVTCHTLPTGNGPDMTFNLAQFRFQPIPPGPNGERHHGLIGTQDGVTNRVIKIPQLRNMYKKVGFEATQVSNRSGFGFLHDGSVDSLARFVSEPIFRVQSNQEVADLVAFLLSFSGSDQPAGSVTNIFEGPGPLSQDSPASVGRQTTVTDGTNPPPQQSALIASMIALAEANRVGLVVKGRQGGIERGYVYAGAQRFQSDRRAVTLTAAQLLASAARGSELTYTVVQKDTETRIGIDRDGDGHYDRDELDAGFDPADPKSHPP